MSDSIVIIPTYNEKENIEKIIRAVFGLEKQFDILVIDDGSPDGTAAIVKGLMAKEFAGRLHILERSGKLGLGTAYIMGFKWSLKQGYDFIFEMDADFSHDPNDLPRLYAATHDEGYDVAVGSRYISGVNVVNWPIGRVLMSYFASKYVRIVTGFKVHDTTAGFVCYRRKVLETIDLDAIRFKGYAFQIEMKYTAHRIGFIVVCADTLSKATDYKDRATCVLFGDAAGAAVVSASEEQGIIATDIGADGSSGHAITSLAYRNDDEETEKRISHRKDTIWMAGQAVMKFAVKAMADASARVVNSAGLTWDDIALVVPHQANYRIVESAVKRMGITDEKVFLNLEKYGNTSASCIPVALTEAVQQGRIKKGDKVVLVGFGGGLTWGAALIEW